MLGLKRQTETVVQPLPRGATGKDMGEHEELLNLQRARTFKRRADEASSRAERLQEDANQAVSEARRAVRRISER